MSNAFQVPLTPDERALLDRIELDASRLEGHEHWKANAGLVVTLFHSLAERGGIPEHRRKCFTDPRYSVGRRRTSVLEDFERNGTRGEEIIRHPHFLNYLRYFLFGPDLPAPVIAAFQREVDECHGHITSSDITKLSAAARRIARAHRLEPSSASEEFFKLGLEHGLSPDYSQFLRNQVRAIRYIYS